MGKVNVVGIIGGALAILSVFLAWISINIGFGSAEITGWDYVHLSETIYEAGVYSYLIPAAVLALGALALLLAGLGVPKALGFIGGMVMILPIAFLFIWLSDMGVLLPGISILDVIGIGAILAVVSGVIMIIAPFTSK